MEHQPDSKYSKFIQCTLGNTDVKPRSKVEDLEASSTSTRLVAGPLLDCKAPVVFDVGLPDANSDKSLRWPSSNSDVKPWFIDDAEVIASWENWDETESMSLTI